MSDENKMPETEPAALVKARFFGAGRDGSEVSNVLETPDEQTVVFNKVGAIPPPLDPVSLASLFEMSGALRANVDSYAVNIDAFGHSLEPVIDPDADDAAEKIRLAITQERMLGLSAEEPTDAEIAKVLSRMVKGELADPLDDPGEVPEPTDAEVTARLKSIRREMVRERLAVDKFFGFVAREESFEHLRMKTRHDLETVGNAYWEVLRNTSGEIVQFDHVPGYSVRLTQMEPTPQTVQMHVRATLITPKLEPTLKRFRKYVQLATGGLLRNQNLVWFKEFGDTRLYSHLSGVEYATPEAMRAEEPEARPATELIHFKIHCSRSAYGMPRWVSEMLSVIGSRHADEVNLAYFENKSVPPMAILVSGGRLVKEDVKRLENLIANEIRGKRNFHKILLLEAESAGDGMPGLSTGRTRIEIKPLTDAQNSDAQFLRYKEANTDAIGAVFRLPRLLRGDARDFNRATAQTSLEFTEQQVFSPLRKDFDYFINRRVLPALGINFWTFRSRGPDFSDPTKMLEAINGTAEASYLTPEELRMLASRAFGVDFPKLDQDWVTRPLPLTLGGITTGQVNPDEASASRDSKGKKVDPSAGTDAKKPEVKRPADKHQVIELSAGRFHVLDPEDEAERMLLLMKAFAQREAEAQL